MGPVNLNLGAEKEKKNERALQGQYHNVAVLCWYTAKGESTPKLIKYQDDAGCLQTLSSIQILRSEKKHYAGIFTHRYDCQSVVKGFQVQFTLLYHPETETWDMIL